MSLHLPPTASSVPEWIRKAAGAVNGLLSRMADKSITITAGTALTGGGDLSANRTIGHADSAVTPGAYTNADITVDAQGHVTAAANGSGGGGGDYVQLGKQVATGVETSFVFSSIPGTYTDLILVIFGRQTTSGSVSIAVTVNSVSAGYDLQRRYSTGTGSAGDNSLNQASWGGVFAIPGSDATAGFSSGGEMRIFGYSQTVFHKSMVARTRQPNSTTTGSGYILNASGQVRTTDAIVTATATISAGAFAAGSYAALYGIR